MKLAMLMLVACGAVIEPLPPNTVQACDRAVECAIFTAEQHGACVACLEHWDAQEGVELPPGAPSLDKVTCDTLSDIAREYRIAECVTEEWWPPADFTVELP